jgi:hypothetical protein
VVSYNGVDGVSNPHFTSCSLSLFGKVVYILDNGVTISRSKLSITLLEAAITGETPGLGNIQKLTTRTSSFWNTLTIDAQARRTEARTPSARWGGDTPVEWALRQYLAGYSFTKGYSHYSS